MSRTRTAALDADASARLARRYPPPRVSRGAAIGIIVVVAAVFVGWVAWAGVGLATPAVSGRINSFEIESDTASAFHLTVERRDPSVTAVCRVIAQADNFERVFDSSGWRIDYLGGTTYQARFLKETFDTMKTFASEQQGEILERMRPLVHRLGVIDPLLEDHRVHLPVWSVVATRLD